MNNVFKTFFGFLLLFFTIVNGLALAADVDVPPFCSNNRDWYKYQCDGFAGCENNNCGPTSYAMIVHYVTGMSFSTAKGSDETCTPEISQEFLINYQNLETEARWRGSDDVYNPDGPTNGWMPVSSDGTTYDQVQSALANEGIDSHVIIGADVYLNQTRENDIDLDLIRDAIDQNKLVIVHVDACEYKEQPCATSHWTLLYGYNDSSNTFSINDPGYQYETLMTYDELKNAMKIAHGGNDEVIIVVDTNSIKLGYYAEGSDGWVEDASIKFVSAYKRNGRYNFLGRAFDHLDGGEWVHPFKFWSNGVETTVHLQDFYHDENGQTTICYLPGADNAYLLQGCLGCIWWEFKDILGAPTSDEIILPEGEQEDGFDIMQNFQYGNAFWDKETQTVRIDAIQGICEQREIDTCGVCYVETDEYVNTTDLILQSADDFPSCTALQQEVGLNDGAWTMFRHDIQHTGKSDYRVVYHPVLKWDYYMGGAILSSPAVASDGTIYVGSNDKYLYAVNPDGSLKWRYQTGSSIQSSPAIAADGTIYVGSQEGNGYLYAINPDGTLKWRYTGASSWFNITSSPVIGTDGNIYFGTSSTVHSYLYSISPDGNLNWRYSGEGKGIVSSPVIDQEGTIYFGTSHVSAPDSLFAIYPDGTLKWRVATGEISSSPAIGPDGTIYVGIYSYYGYNQYVYAFTPGGAVKWSYKTDGEVHSSPAIGSDGTIYVGSRDGYIYAINPNGSLQWRYLTNDDIRSSPAIDAEGTIYVGSYDNHLYAINPDGSRKWRYYTQDNIYSSPAISSSGEIYFGSNDGYFRALGLGDGNGEIYGRVTDFGTTEPIGDVTIEVNGSEVLTRSDGRFGIQVNPGTYNIVASKTGYQNTIINNVIVNSTQFTEINIELNIEGPLNIVTTELSPAEIGIEYTNRVRINGGTAPYSYSIAYGVLPPGLTLDVSDGTISGVPETSGSYTFAIAVSDDAEAYAEREFTIGITDELQVVTQAYLPRGTLETDYFHSIEANGGTYPYTFSLIGGTLPPGVSLSSIGQLSGTISSAGLYCFTIRVTDESGRTAEKVFILETVSPLMFTTTTLNDGIVGHDYEQILNATGGYGGYSWSVYSGVLPAGLSLNSSTGIISGVPTCSTYGVIVLSASDEDGRITYQDYIIEIADPLHILTTTMPNGLVDASYSEAIRLHGGIPPFTFTYTGQLPSGLTLDTDTGIIYGTPDIAGYTNVSITVEDSTYPVSQSIIQNLGIRVTSMLTITTSAILPNGKNNIEMNPIVLFAGGGLSPYEWTIVDNPSGEVLPTGIIAGLPPGISLNSQTGELAGTPTGTGDYIFTIQVEDANHITSQKTFYWHISGELIISTESVTDGVMDFPYIYTLEAMGGLKPYIWRIKNGSLPLGLILNQTTGTIYGTPVEGASESFTVEVNDQDNPSQIAEKTFSIEIKDELFITTQTIPNGRIGNAYTILISAQLGAPPYSWRIVSGDLPPGLEFSSNATIATINGTPTTPGIYTFIVEVADADTPSNTAMKQYSIEIYSIMDIQTVSLSCGLRGSQYTENILTTGGKPPYTYHIMEGNLPDGLSLNQNTGGITGVIDPDSGHSTEFTVRVTDSGNPGSFDEQELVIFVISPVETFASQFGRSDCAGDCPDDNSPDGDIDGTDLLILAENYTQIDNSSPIPAIAFTRSTGGSIAQTTMGWKFTVNDTPIVVTALGLVDCSQFTPFISCNCFSENHEIGIWSTDGTLLTSTIVTPTSPLTDRFRYTPITPIILEASTTYIIGAENDSVEMAFFDNVDNFSVQSEITYEAEILDIPYSAGLNFPTYMVTTNESGMFGPNFLFEPMP